MACIYVITNLINNKQYVGQTRFTAEKRFQKHIEDIPYKNCPYLYSAFEKYGIENFKVETLEECSIDELDEKEIYWINKLNTFYHGYNLTIGGAQNRNFVVEDVVKYYFENEQNTKRTAEYFNISRESVRSAVKEMGYEIRSDRLYNLKEIAEDYKQTQNQAQTMKNFNVSAYVVKEACEEYNIPILTANESSYLVCARPIVKIDPQKDLVLQQYSSLAEAGREIGIPHCESNISACCRGKQKIAYGYRWSYADNIIFYSSKNSKKKAVQQLDKKTNKILNEFESIADAAEYICGIREGSVSKGIANTCRGIQKSCRGYRWRYKEG